MCEKRDKIGIKAREGRGRASNVRVVQCSVCLCSVYVGFVVVVVVVQSK